MNEERLTALSLAIETGTDMHFDKEELEWLIAAVRERNALLRDTLRGANLEKEVLLEEDLEAARLGVSAISKENDTLRASNAALRESGAEFAKYLEWIRAEFFPEEKNFKRQLDAFNATLASTPADDLAEYRDGVLEEAANAVNLLNPKEIYVHPGQVTVTGQHIADKMYEAERAIRAMKAET